VYSTADEFKSDMSFSFGISLGGGFLGPLSGAFSLDKSRKVLNKQFRETDLVMTKKTLDLFTLRPSDRLVERQCLGGAIDGSSSRESCTETVEYSVMDKSFLDSMDEDLPSVAASTLRDAAGEPFEFAQKMAQSDGMKFAHWCAPILVGSLPDSELAQEPFLSMRKVDPLVHRGKVEVDPPMSTDGSTPLKLPVIQVDVLAVLRCVNHESLTKLKGKDMRDAMKDLKVGNQQPVANYGITLDTEGTYIFTNEAFTGVQLKGIEDKMANEVPSYIDAQRRTRKFIWTYGTHYVGEVTMGGMLETKTFFDKKRKKNKEEMTRATDTKIRLALREEVDETTQVEDIVTGITSAIVGALKTAKMLVGPLAASDAVLSAVPDVEAAIKTQSESRTETETVDETDGMEMHFDGGSPTLGMKGDVNGWLKSVIANPAVVGMDLEPISNLIRPGARASCRGQCGKKKTATGCSCEAACLPGGEEVSKAICCEDFQQRCPALVVGYMKDLRKKTAIAMASSVAKSSIIGSLELSPNIRKPMPGMNAQSESWTTGPLSDLHDQQVRVDAAFAAKRSFIEMQIKLMMRVSLYEAEQSDYVDFWKDQAENAGDDDTRNFCNKYKVETNTYRRVWGVLTGLDEAYGNMAPVDCMTDFAKRFKSELRQASKIEKLKERSLRAASAVQARFKNELDLRALIAERQACKEVGKTLCKNYDRKLNNGKLFLVQSETSLRTQTSAKTADVFYNPTTGLFGSSNPSISQELRDEARKREFSCHFDVGGRITPSYCCGARCPNCRNVKNVNDANYDTMKEKHKIDILQSCDRHAVGGSNEEAREE